MAFCSQCGTNVPDNVAFCPSCGKAQAAGSVPVSGTAPAPAGTSGLAENVAGLLCYSVGWITGLIFFFVDKRPFVRWHAAQSIVTFGALHIAGIILSIFFVGGMFWGGGFGGWGVAFLLHRLLELLCLILWIMCMIRAYKGEMFRLPLAANIADTFVK
jgi:uncharacterized membrane protein